MKWPIIIGLVLSLVACRASADTNPPSKFFSQDGRELTATESRDGLSTFGGVGVVIAPVTEGIVVLGVLAETPACSAGIKTGDIIIGVDSKSIQGLKLTDIVHQLRGTVGSEVVLTISRKGQAKPVKLKLVRKEIPVSKSHSTCAEAADK